MTTNKPEVVAYLHKTLDHKGVSLYHDSSCTSILTNTEPLIRLSDYEVLQDTARIALANYHKQ